MSRQILVVDDEANIRELCRLYLEQDGFQVLEAESGTQALALVREFRPALAVLDLMLPDMSGFDLCKALQEWQTPVIMLTARTDEVDKILGLELGADDYLTKPFSPREMVARVKTVLRRVAREGALAAAAPKAEQLVYPDFSIDLPGRTLLISATRLDLPPKEFDLLVTLARSPQRVFTREQLLEQVWDYSYFGDFRTVDVHVQRIRRKIEPDPDKPRYIKTVWGIGYKFDGGSP